MLTAFGRFVRQPRGLLTEQDAAARERLTAVTRVIEGSPALREREQRIFAGYTTSLARLLADEQGTPPGQVTPWVAANALMGVHRALVASARRRIVAGAGHAAIRRELLREADAALALLEGGLGGYAVKG